MTVQDEARDPVRLARRLATFGLGGGAPTEPIRIPLGTWFAFHERLRSQQLVGLAVAAHQAGLLAFDEAQRSAVLRDHRDAMTWCLDLERHLVALADAFAERGVEFLVLKGPAFAHALYPDPAWRPFRDLDVLVRTRDWRRASETLLALGYRRERPEPRAGFDERFGKAAVHVNESGIPVDLHRTLVLGPFGLWMDPAPLFDRAGTFELADRTIRRCSFSDMFLNACIHASLGWRRLLLLPLRDVAQAMTSSNVNWSDFVRSVRDQRQDAVVQHAFTTVANTLPGVVLPPVADEIMRARPRRTERRALAAYVTDERSRGGTELATLRAIPGVSGRLRFIVDLMFPSRAFVAAAKGRRAGSYLWRWSVPLRWTLDWRRRDSRSSSARTVRPIRSDPKRRALSKEPQP